MPHPNRPKEDTEFWFTGEEIPDRPRRMGNLFGAGRLANRRDLRDLLEGNEKAEHALHLPLVSLLVEAHADGSQLEPILQQPLCIPAELRERHILLSGATGVGKTQKWILPQLAADIADPKRTIIALDAKGGVLHEFMTQLARKHRPGKTVHQINMRRPERNTIVWNPVSHVETRSEAMEVAHAVCTNADLGVTPKDPFWVNSSIALLKDLIHALAHDPKEDQSLVRAKNIVDHFPVAMQVFAKQQERKYPAIQRVLDSPSQNPSTSIIADLAQRLLLFDDEGVVECTCQPNQLDVRGLLETGGMLVVEVFEADAAEMLALTNLFVTQLFRCAMNVATAQPNGRLPRPTSLILDELGSACGVIPELDKRLSTMRSRGVSITGAVQTLSQLENLYGKAAEPILEGFNTKIFFGGGLSLSDSEFASRLSGMITCESISYTDSEDDDTLGKTHTTRTRSPVGRAVLLPGEIARPPYNRLLGPPATVFTPHLPPFFAYFTPAYQQPELESAMTSEDGSKTVAQERKRHRRRRLRKKILDYKKRLDWGVLDEKSRQWWKNLELKLRKRPTRFLQFLRALRRLVPLHRRLSSKEGEGILIAFSQLHHKVDHSEVETTLAKLHSLLCERLAQQRGRNAE